VDAITGLLLPLPIAALMNAKRRRADARTA